MSVCIDIMIESYPSPSRHAASVTITSTSSEQQVLSSKLAIAINFCDVAKRIRDATSVLECPGSTVNSMTSCCGFRSEKTAIDSIFDNESGVGITTIEMGTVLPLSIRTAMFSLIRPGMRTRAPVNRLIASS